MQKFYHDNGRLRKECTYVEHKLEGEFKSWNESGNLLLHLFYKKGKMDGECKFYDLSGKLYKHCRYKNDLLDGKSIFSNDAIISIGYKKYSFHELLHCKKEVTFGQQNNNYNMKLIK